MPTARSAVPSRPRISRRRIASAGLSALIGLAVVLAAGTLVAPSVDGRAAPGTCPGWSSTTRPPDYIRVLRVHRHRVERVPFRKYVVTVMGKEWPSYLPQPVVEAGAVAVKQYAWYHALGNARRTSWGQCYDVRDSTGDQLYKPSRARIRPDHYSAVDATWGIHLLKDGRLFMTGYRRGDKVRCGRDRTGYKLFARSAVQCARRGYDFRAILRLYYNPGVEIVGNGAANQRPVQVPAQSRPQGVYEQPIATSAPSSRAVGSRPIVAPSGATTAPTLNPTWGGGLAGGVGSGSAAAVSATAGDQPLAARAFTVL